MLPSMTLLTNEPSDCLTDVVQDCDITSVRVKLLVLLLSVHITEGTGSPVEMHEILMLSPSGTATIPT